MRNFCIFATSFCTQTFARTAIERNQNMNMIMNTNTNTHIGGDRDESSSSSSSRGRGSWQGQAATAPNAATFTFRKPKTRISKLAIRNSHRRLELPTPTAELKSQFTMISELWDVLCMVLRMQWLSYGFHCVYVNSKQRAYCTLIPHIVTTFLNSLLLLLMPLPLTQQLLGASVGFGLLSCSTLNLFKQKPGM